MAHLKVPSSSPSNSPSHPIGAHIKRNSSANVSLALSGLKDVLEAVNTVPCVKYIASVAIKILEVIDEVQANKDACLSLATRAKEVALAVAHACGDNGEADAGEKLEEDLLQLTTTMEEIMQFATSQTSRSKYKRFIYKSEDADTAKRLDVQLTQAFQLFSVSAIDLVQFKILTASSRTDTIQYEHALVAAIDGPADRRDSKSGKSSPDYPSRFHPLKIVARLYVLRRPLSSRTIPFEFQKAYI
ncbi:hypothetical protein PILCRDRAFT_7302 [Piloderma croceum F 1598]|uniref:Mixed lineage kinase domain-containing protein n=1 Tax=Piloderma croceum (strain F 1598) TaxID=765440 RepID=A0A0C3FG42_PILCF|nr:hypothetical protein PILCRDRAFT_7302 [Piloderma croceum F 1598]